MTLTDHMQAVLVDELRYVLQRMKQAKEPAAKMYFFSAIYGSAFRIMNIEFDPELSFVHATLKLAHDTINGRLNQPLTSEELGSGIPDQLFSRLEETVGALIEAIDNRQPTYKALQTISNLAYSTTGNGYYLYLRDRLKV